MARSDRMNMTVNQVICWTSGGMGLLSTAIFVAIERQVK
jgi:hypothetical protein